MWEERIATVGDNFTLWDNTTYQLKAVYTPGVLNLYCKSGNDWVKINASDISIAELIGDSFDISQGVQIGLASWDGSGCTFNNITVTEHEITLHPEILSVRDSGTYDIFTGNYTTDNGTALTADTYLSAELEATLLTNGWPMEGFAIKQGDNMVTFRFSTKAAAWQGAEQIRYFVNGVENTVWEERIATVGDNFTLWDNRTYNLKAVYENGILNIYNNVDGNWVKVNAEAISIASLLGDSFDASQGVQIGLASWDGSGCTFNNITVTEIA